jgi:diamine N-acetyltransferase
MITYRAPEMHEARALGILGRDSFREAFGHLYSAENLTLFEAQTYTPDVITAEIANPNRKYLIAEDQGRMIGYCKIGFDKTLDYDWSNQNIVELKQLYIFASHHGCGVAQSLMDWAIFQAKNAEANAIVLSVYSDNPRGQRFYQKYGFAHIADTFFMVGQHRDDEFLYLRFLED